MNRTIKRAKLATQIKACFAASDPSWELFLLAQITKDVYLEQKKDVSVVASVSNFSSVQSAEKVRG